MSADLFSTRLRDWRKTHRIKQATLAFDLGVTQAAVSRWENGVDLPSAPKMQQLRALMHKPSEQFLAEQRYIQRLTANRALFTFDGLRLQVASRGISRIWPDFARMQGTAFADLLVEETAAVIHDCETAYHVRQKSSLLITGVSDRHISLDVDTAFRHRWHACVRNIDGLAMVDMSFESCANDTATGIEDVFYPEDLIAV